MVIMTNSKFQSFSDDLEAFVWPDEDQKQRNKRQRILKGATELFIRLGYRKTSVDAIAKQAGLAKGTVYLYYSNKSEIVLHAIALEKSAYLRQLVEHISEGLSPGDVLRTVIVIGVVMSREMPLTASLVRGDNEIAIALAEVDEPLKSAIGKMQYDAILELLDDATHHELKRTQLKILSQTLVDLLNSVFLSQHIWNSEIPIIKYAQTLADMLVDGLVNTNEQHSSESLRPLYNNLTKRFP